MNQANNSKETIYPNLQAAEAAVCQKWCQENGYENEFFQNGSWWAFPHNSVMPVRIHEILDIKNTHARRVLIQNSAMSLSIALFPDGCLAPPNHPEI